MMSAGDIVLEYVSPGAGTIAAFFMFAAPVRDVRKCTLQGEGLGDLNPTPWAFMLGNCTGWIAYSFLIQNLFVFFANLSGFLLAVWLNLQAAKLQYEHFRSQHVRTSIVHALDEHKGVVDYAKVVWNVTAQKQKAPASQETLVMCIVVFWCGVIACVAFGDDAFTSDARELIVGIAVNLNLVFFYGAPLSTIATVLRTRSSSTIHIPTMITNTATAAFWCAYGVAIMDPFIGVPNGLGALLGAVQIVLYVLFPRKSETKEEEESESKELQEAAPHNDCLEEPTPSPDEATTDEEPVVDSEPSTP